MDTADLRIFEAVARLKGMDSAAAELQTPLTTVMARLRHLETNLGMALFARHGEGLALTSDGRRFLPYASRLRQIVDEAQRAAEEKGPSEAL